MKEKRISIRLSQAVYDELKRRAGVEDTSVSHIARRVLTDFVNKAPLAGFGSSTTVKEAHQKKDEQ